MMNSLHESHFLVGKEQFLCNILSVFQTVLLYNNYDLFFNIFLNIQKILIFNGSNVLR